MLADPPFREGSASRDNFYGSSRSNTNILLFFFYVFEGGKRIRSVIHNKNEFVPRPRFQVKNLAEKTYRMFWSSTHYTPI